MATTNISIRMEESLKKEADQLFNEMGMNISTAFNIFVRRAIRERAIPFHISLGELNHETIAAMLEAERIAKDPNIPSYVTAKEALAAALCEDN
ncbi:type II toxin-antitoxin system RelB/DinJ family antitoxin [Collinsella sp. zg1085]|uniref:type II toxin-antitoxin system RelB/DinJ family antitoxin n=1 Tax=Collinsella sp. zg1085 TaxID=2844380 RepID=UPI001C0B9532|nr:type II toxin-antitoxin system RelB/DinJ family antitoxin [Collinsella sp. zg1085]QWT17696.1 type II toxin-antitoxin system RelB/DinJ family antitoxin [Collinsella sp. zg1085]